MPFDPTVFVNNQQPSITAAQLNKLGSQYDQVVADIEDGVIPAAATDESVSAILSNPESASNSDVVDIATSVVGSATDIIHVVKETLTDINAARPVGGVAFWLLTPEDFDDGIYPTYFQDGDIRARATATTPPFSPLDISGTTAIYDAASLSLTDGASVSTWPNLVTGQPSASPVGGTQPVYRATLFNASKPTVQFNGVAGLLKAAGFSSYTGTITMYCVGQSLPTTPSGTDFFYDGATSTLTSLRLALARNATNQWVIYRSANFTVAGANNSPHIFKVVYNVAASSLTVLPGGTPTTGTTSSSSDMTDLALGGRADAAASNMLDGYLSYVHMVRGTVASEDETALISYLTTRYGF